MLRQLSIISKAIGLTFKIEAAGGRQAPCDHIEKRGFPGTIRAQYGQNFTGSKIKRDTLQHRLALVGFMQRIHCKI